MSALIAALSNQVPVVCFLLHSAALLFVETATLRVALLYVTTATLRVASSAQVLRLPLSACAVGTVCGVPCAPNQPGFCRRHLRCDKPRVCIFSPFGWRKRPRTQCKLTAYRTNESRCGAVRCGAVRCGSCCARCCTTPALPAVLLWKALLSAHNCGFSSQPNVHFSFPPACCSTTLPSACADLLDVRRVGECHVRLIVCADLVDLVATCVDADLHDRCAP